MSTLLGPVIQEEGRIHYGDDGASFALIRETRNVSVIARFTVSGEPVSKARARFTNYNSKTKAYTPEKTKTAEEKMGWLFRQAAPGHQPDSVYTYGICAVFFHGTRQRRDVDNMLKLVSDALNGVAWVDDVQVEEVSGRRGHDSANPRTEVLVYRIGLAERGPVLTCAQCGKEFKTYESWARRKYCSTGCHIAAQTARRKRQVCPQCLKEFLPPSNQPEKVYCSADCRTKRGTAEWNCVKCGKHVVSFRSQRSTTDLCGDVECARLYWNDRRRTAAKGICDGCGGPTSKKQYRRCVACRTKPSASSGESA